MESKQNIIIAILILLAVLVFVVGMYMILNKNQLVEERSINDNLTDGGITLVNPTTTSPISVDQDVSNEEAQASTTAEQESSSPLLFVGKEIPGRGVFVDIAVLTEPGFIVIYESSALPTGELLGYSMYLNQGEYTNIPINLFRDVQDGESFDVFIHTDNGDQTFLLKDDPPYRSANGSAVVGRLEIEQLPPSS